MTHNDINKLRKFNTLWQCIDKCTLYVDHQSLKTITEEDERWKLGEFMYKFMMLAKYSTAHMI